MALDAAIVATNPETQARLEDAFGVADPWTLAKLAPPPGGPHVQSAAALAHPALPGRLLNRLGSVPVAIVLDPPLVQCQHQFNENRESGAEWRPLSLAIAHAATLSCVSRDIVEHDGLVDGFFPQFDYVSLPDHLRWVPRWTDTFGEKVLVVQDDRSEAMVAALEEHLGQSIGEGHASKLTGTAQPSAPQGETWEWVRELINA